MSVATANEWIFSTYFIPAFCDPFCMANHLDDIVLVEKSGKLQPSIGVDAIITPEDRVDYLRNKTGVEIQDVRLEDWNASVVSDSTRLLIVRSVGIDTAGEMTS